MRQHISITVLSLCAAVAAAQNNPTSALTVSATIDDEDNTTTFAEVTVPAGQYFWLYGGIGASDAQDTQRDVSSDLLSLGIGASVQQFDMAVGFIDRDGDEISQEDLTATIQWHVGRGGVGVNFFQRNAESETTTSLQRRRVQPRVVRVVESLDGHGFGIHGNLDVTDAINVYVGYMGYDYAEVNSSHPFLSRVLSFNGSGVTRDLAFIEEAFQTSLTYRWASASVSAHYLRDEALETADVTDTFEISALWFIGDYWSLSPVVGYSDSEHFGSIGYAGVSIGYNW